MKATVEIKGSRSNRNWVHGTVAVDDGSKFDFEAKVYDEPSQFGVDSADSPIGKAKAEAILDAIVYKLETIVDMNTSWAKRYDSTM